MKPKIPVLTRLQTHHIKDNNGCWNWSKHRGFWGYGLIKVDGKVELAHRIAYKHMISEFPSELCVLHRCDNPACINPDHLFLGTNADNMKDKVQKGRQSNVGEYPGEKHHNAKLTEKDVLNIRTKQLKQSEYAQIYGVSQALISNIQLNKCWTHI